MAAPRLSRCAHCVCTWCRTREPALSFHISHYKGTLCSTLWVQPTLSPRVQWEHVCAYQCSQSIQSRHCTALQQECSMLLHLALFKECFVGTNPQPAPMWRRLPKSGQICWMSSQTTTLSAISNCWKPSKALQDKSVVEGSHVQAWI
eukprot:196577-Amphidinium_carterae.1